MNRRGIRLAWIRFRRRQRMAVAVQAPDETLHTCRHCGYQFVGRMCPQCGMPGGWTRFTARKLFYGFLDIWGLGNRPMFRSMGHLLWRPGYMIRDYLDGHYLSYFPPFKMLAVVTVLVAFTIWLLGIDATDTEVSRTLADGLGERLSPTVMNAYLRMRDFFLGNTLYRLLLQILMMVAAVWVVFRRRGLNLVETSFAMVYISCQMQLITIGWLIVTRRFLATGIYPYSLPQLLIILLLMLDFSQLYGLRLWGAVWRTLVTTMLLLLFYLVVILGTIATLVVATLAEKSWQG